MNEPKQVLVTYYSLTGNTARVAQDLASRLGADVETIQDPRHGKGTFGQFTAAFDAWRKAPARIGFLRHDPAHYALTVVGTPVWMWQMTPAIRAYLNTTRGRARHLAFFVTSGDTDIKRVAPSLEAAAGQRAVALTGFNARELANHFTYERKLGDFIEAIRRACSSMQRVA